MEEKVFKHLGYSPGEEMEVIFGFIDISNFEETKREELLWAQHLRGVNSICSAVSKYQNLVEFTQSNPRNPIDGMGEEWDNKVVADVVDINKTLTENILDSFSLLKTLGVTESVIHNDIAEQMKNLGIKDNIFFPSDTSKTLFAFARHIILHQFRVPNLAVQSLSVRQAVKMAHGEYNSFKAANSVGLELLMYLKMFTTDYIANFNMAVTVYERTPTEAHHLTMRSMAVKTLISQFILLELLGYEKDMLVPLVKTLCQ